MAIPLCLGSLIFGRAVASERRLHIAELDDHVSLERLPLQNLRRASAREENGAKFLERLRRDVRVVLVFRRIKDSHMGDPVRSHLCSSSVSEMFVARVNTHGMP